MGLQNANNMKELEVGSSPQNAIDKQKHRQNDPRGWKLIHYNQPLNKAKEWLDALLPLIDCIKQKDANDETILFICIANLKYLLYTKHYEQSTNDFERMRYVLKCCLEINGLFEQIGYSIKDILEKIMKTQCSPMQCVDIRNDLLSSDSNKELKIFENYVTERYPLQLKTEKAL